MRDKCIKISFLGPGIKAANCEKKNPGVKKTMASVQFHSSNKYFTPFYCIRQTARLLILSKGRRQTDGHGLHTKISFSLPLRSTPNNLHCQVTQQS